MVTRAQPTNGPPVHETAGTSGRHLAQEAELLAAPVGEETRLTGRVWRSGSGAVLTDVDGRDHVDLASGILTQSLGHCHPDVVAAVCEQAAQLENVHDSPTPARLRAALALRRLLPERLNRIAFFTTGAEVVEAALRVVYAAADSSRRRIVALRKGFHGKTRGARSLVHWDVGGESPAASMLGYAAYCFRCPFQLRYPSCDLLCARLTAAQALSRKDVAALVAEPIQGAAGVIIPPPGYWEILVEACRRNGVLIVADEVLTGGGRTGTFLAGDRFGIEPDLVTLAKGLGSGHPVAALAGTSHILTASTIADAGGFSSTYAGNPVGLAASAATLEAIARDDLLARVRHLGDLLRDALGPIEAMPPVGEIRQAGLLCGIEFVSDRGSRQPDPTFADQVVRRAAELGVRVIPGGHVIRLAPPFVIGEDELRDAVRRLGQAIVDVRRGAP